MRCCLLLLCHCREIPDRGIYEQHDLDRPEQEQLPQRQLLHGLAVRVPEIHVQAGAEHADKVARSVPRLIVQHVLEISSQRAVGVVWIDVVAAALPVNKLVAVRHAPVREREDDVGMHEDPASKGPSSEQSAQRRADASLGRTEPPR